MGKILCKILKGQNINSLNINILQVMVWLRNNKVIKFVLVTLEVSIEYRISAQSVGWAVDKTKVVHLTTFLDKKKMLFV